MNRIHLIALVFSLSFFGSCQKDAKVSTVNLLSYLPASSSVVGSFSLDQLIGHPDFKASQEGNCFQEMIAKTKQQNPVLSAILDQPQQSGLYLEGSAYLIYDIKPKNINHSFVALIFPINDKNAFDQLVARSDYGTVKSENDYQLATRANTIVGWNNNIAVLGGINYRGDLEEHLLAILQSDGQSTLADQEDLQKCMNRTADVKIWINSSHLAKSQEIKSILGLAGFDPDLLNGNYIHHYVDFEKGKVTGESNFYLQESLQKDLNLFFKDRLSADFSKQIPADNDFLMTAALDIEGIKTFLSSRLQISMVTNFALKEYGLSLDDLPKIFGGDLFSAVKNVDNRPTVFFSGSIRDKTGFQQLLDALMAKGFLKKQGEDEYQVQLNTAYERNGGSNLNLPKLNNYLWVNEEQFFVSSEMDYLEAIKKDQVANSIDSKTYQSMAGHLFGIRMGIDNLGKDVQSPFANVEVTGNRQKVDYQLNLKNESENSLAGFCALLNAF